MKEITVIVPKALDVSSLPNSNGLKRDKFAWLLAEMYRLYNYRRYSTGEFVRLSSTILQSYLGNNYKRYIEWLIGKNMVTQGFYTLANGNKVEYIKGHKCKCYGISKELLKYGKKYKITDKVTIKAILRNQKSLAYIKDEPYRTMLGHVQSVDVDMGRAFQWIKAKRRSGCIVAQQARSYFNSVGCIREGAIFFRVADKNGRVDTPVTNLKSELRSFLRFDGYASLSQIDIKNSQPFLLSVLLQYISPSAPLHSSPRARPPLCCTFLNQEKDLISAAMKGTFYEELQLLYNTKNNLKLNRSEAKKVTMRVLYSENQYIKDNKAVFRDTFPNIYDYIREWKEGDHSKLAVDLQKVESELMIKGVAAELVSKYDFPFLTVHDSVIFPTEYTQEVRSIIDGVFYREVSVKPPVTTEIIN